MERHHVIIEIFKSKTRFFQIFDQWIDQSKVYLTEIFFCLAIEQLFSKNCVSFLIYSYASEIFYGLLHSQDRQELVLQPSSKEINECFGACSSQAQALCVVPSVREVGQSF